jgi:hypothetical protein
MDSAIGQEEITMVWAEIRMTYPNRWLVVEALEAHTGRDNLRQLTCLAVIETCRDGDAAMRRYRQLHLEHPDREFYFVHTSREELNIRERYWAGIRRSECG